MLEAAGLCQGHLSGRLSIRLCCDQSRDILESSPKLSMYTCCLDRLFYYIPTEVLRLIAVVYNIL